MSNNISLYIAAYNAEKTIEKSIKSILQQTLKPKEIIIINDCSTDKTLNLLKKFNQIKIINNKKNYGLAKSRNIALKYSKYNFLASIDSDVVCKKNWLETLFNTMVKKKADLIGGKLIDKYIKEPANHWRSYYLKQNWGDKQINNPQFIFGANFLLNKKKIKNLNIKYNETFRTNGEDVNFSKVLKSKNCNLYYEPKALCYHYQFDDITSLSKRYWRYSYYGAGLKKLTLTRLIRLILRQTKVLFYWMYRDLLKKNYHFLNINLIMSYYFIILCINEYLLNEKK
jgi:glycosyltransferase involved in cell wall biosynthesis